MQAIFNHLNVSLARSETLALSRAAAAAITVLSGSVWVTRAGDRHDHVLRAGDSLRLGGDGSAVLMGLACARLLVESPRRAPSLAGRAVRLAHALYLRLSRRLAGSAMRRRVPAF